MIVFKGNLGAETLCLPPCFLTNKLWISESTSTGPIFIHMLSPACPVIPGGHVCTVSCRSRILRTDRHAGLQPRAHRSMHVVRLSIHRLRRFQTVELHPSSALNLLTGDNGAGKTSVLEALHLMAYGRSFRGRVRDGVIQQGANDLEVFVEWKEGGGAAVERTRRAGLRHSGQEWTGRLDGEDVAQLGSLCAALAVVTFEPGSHVLISGG
ncbi:AAA family ATPase, partial [Xanthomonas citri]|uniref:AAA family ATPase n=1 Tax=Xanthomonas citri TaxID=346 RepID=UPI001FEEB557